MNKIITILKKELKRFFSDKRMLMTLFMPGILIFVIYTLMGTFMSDAFNPDKNYQYNIVTVNMPNEYQPIIDNSEFDINVVKDDLTVDEIKQKIVDQKLDLYIEFEDDFINKVTSGLKPKVSIFYNTASNESFLLYNYIYSTISQLGMDVEYNFLVNMDPNLKYDLATNEDMSVKMITMILPYILVIFLFSGCLAVTTESIAGEKERGTINTLLVTPTKRSHIAIGKILALSITSLVSGTTSFIGILLSLPSLIKGSGEEGITLSMYNVGTYAAIFAIIILTVILFTTVLAIVSTFAKNVKEANQWASVIMIVVMLLGITSLVGNGKTATNPLLYLIPVYNNVQCMTAIFGLQFSLTNFLVTIISNVCYIALGVCLLARMFNSEKIMSAN